RWSIFKDKEIEPRGYARTAINFRHQEKHRSHQVRPADEWEFELWGEFKLWKTTNTMNQPDYIVRNQYRVTREGELREFHSKVSFVLKTKIPASAAAPANSTERSPQDD